MVLYLILIKPDFGWRFRQLAGISLIIGNKGSGRIASISLLNNSIIQKLNQVCSKNSSTDKIKNFSNNSNYI